MIRYKGTAKRVRRPIAGLVTHEEKPLMLRPNYVYVGDNKPGLGYAGVITTKHPSFSINFTPTVYCFSKEAICNLKDNDIVSLNSNGDVSILWNHGDVSNCILMTEKCNCRCVMCPQPPRLDPPHLDLLNRRILRLITQLNVNSICITGGEPTLNRKRFIEYLLIISSSFPNAKLDVLTNGQTFASYDFARHVASVSPSNMTLCISLHADTAGLHNFITGTNDGFRKTIIGIRNLGKLGINVEIRFVISNLNCSRLVDFASFIGTNFPFINHVAFIGMEITGDALQNLRQIWVDPIVYRAYILQAIRELHRRGIHTSIYNVPLCLTDRRIWNFARQSISSWKNSYLPQCYSCSVKDSCCGIFTTSQHHSAEIRPV